MRDLASGNPDPRLLPPLRPALDAMDATRATVNNVDSVLPELAQAAGARFAAAGIPVRDVAAFSGALDAMERVLVAHLTPGARVLVEDPGYPPVAFLLAALGLRIVPFGVDEAGLLADGLAGALPDVAAMIVTPRAQNPTGAALTGGRAAALRAVLDGFPDLLVIEDDHASDIAGADAVSLAEGGRSRWAVIRSASKSLGADLRLAVMAADRATMTMVRGRQRRGPGWVSGLLQQVVLHQWTAPGSLEQLTAARAAYAERRQALIGALAGHGIGASGRTGLNVWIPVDDEGFVVAHLREAGYAVSAGQRFRRQSGPAVRITISTLPPAQAPAVAVAVAAAVTAQRSSQGVRT
jgi:DNA-binding transcriptional MocR family regulator